MSERVGVGEHCVARGKGTLAVIGLGSCVAIILYDEKSGVGGLAHVMLPKPSYSTRRNRKMRFATTAVPALVKQMVAAGARRERITARLVGGSCMFRELLANDVSNIGELNVSAAKEALSGGGIAIVGEETGGDYGRSIYFRLTDGSVRVTAYGRADVLV